MRLYSEASLNKLMFVCICAFSVTLGCVGREASFSNLKITPSVVELGEVASAGQQVTATIQLSNLGAEPVAVELEPSCGCILSDVDEFTLSAGESCEVSLAISTSGRSGDFHAELVVNFSGGSQRVPVKATFLPQVSVFPSRVVLLPTEDGLSGEVQIEAPPELWPILKLDGHDEELEVTLLESDGRKQRYHVVSKHPVSTYSPLVVRKVGQETPVLTIPLICGVPSTESP